MLRFQWLIILSRKNVSHKMNRPVLTFLIYKIYIIENLIREMILNIIVFDNEAIRRKLILTAKWP